MSPPHVTVCICTFRRPELLDALLTALSKQKTERRLTFSVRVVDNDPGQSARSVVAKWAASGCFPVEACSELRQNIARARNRAVADINCDYVAMIDDDEVPCDDWLLRLVGLIESSGADGVLGPVYPAYRLAVRPGWSAVAFVIAPLIQRDRLYSITRPAPAMSCLDGQCSTGKRSPSRSSSV